MTKAMQNDSYRPSEMSELDLGSLEDPELPHGHKAGFVAVAGRPNTGKSTLMNALLRQKLAIVSPRPQTTRARQLGILTLPDCQIIFVDTPGLVKPRHKLDEAMTSVADDSVRDADVVLWVVDAGEPPGPADIRIAKTLQGLPGQIQVVLALNKSDLLLPEDVISRTDAYRALLPEANWVLISAVKGDGLDNLLGMLREVLPEGPRFFPADQTTDSYVRDMAAELVREQIFLQMRDELPYGSFVRVDEYKLRANGVTYISAVVYVERENHKKIIIGTKGRQLRRIGAAARREIEELVHGKVFLELWVKVEPNWRRSEQALKRLGYTE